RPQAERPWHADDPLDLQANGIEAEGHLFPERGAARAVLRPGRRGRRPVRVRRPETPEERVRRDPEGDDVPYRAGLAEGWVTPRRVHVSDQLRTALLQQGGPGHPHVARRRDGDRDPRPP